MAISALINIVLPAQQFDATVRFYRDILALPIYHDAAHSCFLKIGEVYLAIYPTSEQDPLRPTGRSLYLDFAVDDRDAMVEQLSAAGVEINRVWDDHVGRFVLIADPEGNWIELIEYER
jgi:predicted enzyme related to lactoylglutathione lyase